MPTWFEKLSWSQGDGAGLRTAEVGVGREMGEGGKVRVGTLICGENTNPLARYAVMSQGEHVHVSTWPAVWPTRMPGEKSTVGSAKGRNYDNVLANRLRAGAHCFEAKCFGVMCAAHLSRENVQMIGEVLGDRDVKTKDAVRFSLENTSRAASMFLDPTGTPVPSWVVNEKGERAEKEMLMDEEGLLFADLDLNECVEGKQYHDLVGGYQRFDIFSLRVNRTRREPVEFIDNTDSAGRLPWSSEPASQPDV